MNMQFPFDYLEAKNDCAKGNIWLSGNSLPAAESKACYKHANNK